MRATAMPVVDAPSAATAIRSSNRRTSSSSTKTAPAIGAFEGGGKAGTRTGRNQRPAIEPLAAADFSHKVSNTRPHLHARALATERKPGADCEHTAAEFHPDEVKRRLRDLLVQHGLDMRDAASRCVR